MKSINRIGIIDSHTGGTNAYFVTVPGISPPQFAPGQLPFDNPIWLGRNGSRLSMTAIRNGFLWTSQAIGLNGTNGAYSGNQTGTNVDRSGVQWLQFAVDQVGGSLSHISHGRIYDPASTNAYYYYNPSLMVNCAGDMVLGFSGSSPTNYIGAFYSWRLASGAMLSTPGTIRLGTTTLANVLFGDYSATTVDPTDDWSFWTVQQYAHPSGIDDNGWHTTGSAAWPTQ